MSRIIDQTRISAAIYYSLENITIEPFYLSRQVEQNLLEEFQVQTGLADLHWETIYFQFPDRERTISQTLAEADGYVFFMHGWCGSHRIWESLPFQLATKHKHVVCFNLDVNGFGESPFLNDTPYEKQCSPAALMTAVEHWLRITNLYPAPNRKRRPFYLFVGHSMGGAATFYKDVTGWEDEVYGFYALAPALLCKDTQQQAAFKTVGLGIRLPSFTAVKNALALHIIDIFGGGASDDVKNEHLRIYNQTPFGTLAQTLYVLGTIHSPPKRTDWSRYKVALGRKDRAIRVHQMLNLLKELNFPPDQIRVMSGDHYFFSYGPESPPSHKPNRQVILDDLLSFCRQLGEETKENQV